MKNYTVENDILGSSGSYISTNTQEIEASNSLHAVNKWCDSDGDHCKIGHISTKRGLVSVMGDTGAAIVYSVETVSTFMRTRTVIKTRLSGLPD